MMPNDNEFEAICQHSRSVGLTAVLSRQYLNDSSDYRLRKVTNDSKMVDWNRRDNCSITQHDPSWRVHPIVSVDDQSDALGQPCRSSLTEEKACAKCWTQPLTKTESI